MLFQVIVVEHSHTASIRILAIDLRLIEQSVNVSGDILNLRVLLETFWASILFNQRICYAFAAEYFFAITATF